MIVTEDPIFKSVGHALRIAFLMENIQHYPKCNLSKLIDQAKEQYGELEIQEKTVNWGGLNDLEKIAQCVMIRSVCYTRLGDDLKNYVFAKYSQNPMEAIPAMRQVAENVVGVTKIDTRNVVFHMCLNAVRGTGYSAGEIAKRFKVSRGYVQADLHRIKNYCVGADKGVYDELCYDFWDGGVI